MLTSQAREALRGVETVIVDEVHAVAGTKRGAHLALSLERLDELLDRPAQRIGLSATVRPVDEVARFLGGSAPVEVVAPASEKEWDLKVVVPVEDMRELDAEDDDGRTGSLWPHVEARVLDLIEQHKSTIVFANSRRLAERLTARLNELAAEREEAGTHRWSSSERSERSDETTGPQRTPAETMAQSGQSEGATPLVARAHHGSVSKEQRAVIEDDLKRGRLPCVVATSSLELGIDMGAVDLVVQIESPPSVASALQRVGRAGHQVGEVSRGVLFPKHRGDLVPSAVTVERMRSGGIEALHVPANPLDVLAQQVVAATSMDDLGRRQPLRRRTPVGSVRHPPPQRVRRDAGPALRPLPQRRVRRAATPTRLGPGLRRAQRATRCAAARGHERRHHPRPRAVRGLPRRREGLAGRRARRGDGLRVPRR